MLLSVLERVASNRSEPAFCTVVARFNSGKSEHKRQRRISTLRAVRTFNITVVVTHTLQIKWYVVGEISVSFVSGFSYLDMSQRHKFVVRCDFFSLYSGRFRVPIKKAGRTFLRFPVYFIISRPYRRFSVKGKTYIFILDD